MFNPSDEFNGILQRVKGMDYKSKEAAEAEVTMPEIAGAKFPLVVPGARVTESVAADMGVPEWPADTLAADVAAGATSVVVTGGADVALANPSAAADDIIDTTPAHGFAAGDAVVFTALTGGAGLVVNQVYYVIAANLAANTFQVSATPGGAAVNFTTDITAGTVVQVAAPGDIIHISDGTNDEYRVVDAVTTATTYTFRDALLHDYSSGDAVTQAESDGKTEIRGSLSRRLPDAAYHDWVLTPQSGSDWFELYLYNAVATQDTAELSFGNESMAAVKATIGSRWDGIPGTDSWLLRVPA
jgi:hypothetical protein